MHVCSHARLKNPLRVFDADLDGKNLVPPLVHEGDTLFEVDRKGSAVWIWRAAEHLDSILRNLVLNARDALRERQSATGQLESLPPGRIVCSAQPSLLSDGTPAWELRVSDNGAGIPAAIRARIFEPFFSTKPNTGTGLGLNTVRKLIWMYGGDIRFDNPPEGGTVFTLRLPGDLAPSPQGG